MQKPYQITKLENSQDISQLDNLLTSLFEKSQDKEHRYIELSGAGVWPTVDIIPEKQFILCQNITDGTTRIYTKVKGVLKYIALT